MYTNYKLISSRKWLITTGFEPRISFFEHLTHWCMIESNLTPMFKYNTLRCCQIRNIFSKYIQTTYWSFCGNDYPFKSWKPVLTTFRKLNTAVNDSFDISPQFKMAHSSINWGGDIFVIYRATKAISSNKNVQYIQGWNPTTIYFQKFSTVGEWWRRQALNRLKINRLLWSEMIRIMRTPRSGPGQFLTLVG